MTEYQYWLENAVGDEDMVHELQIMSEEEKKCAFSCNLTFGTGGLRGIIGAGTNRMNIYTVAKASQGLSDYLIKKYGSDTSVIIGYDSRIKSDTFAKVAAAVFAANGITVYIWPKLSPVSTVSFATRYLGASAGVMITASHNPSNYNGYKVYGSDGCQITTKIADDIMNEIEKLDIFADIKICDFNDAVAKDLIIFIDDSILNAFLEAIKTQSVLFGDEINTDISIVYSPLNGTGYIPITRILTETGYTNITLVEEQMLPNGNFPTCPYPNPEIKETMSLGIEYAKKINADIVLATDPDCDRVGIAIKNNCGEYIILSGNEIGILLFDYICFQRIKHGMMPDNPMMIKTIVTTDMATQIAASYGVRTIDVLTGFKFIGEQVSMLEKQSIENNFIFGFEESYGYLSGGYVRDKDAVGGVYLICEMFSYYKTRGISLYDKLNELYDKYGYCLNTLHFFEYKGESGSAKIQKIMKICQEEIGIGFKLANKEINTVIDYNNGLNGLPKSNVLKYIIEENCSVVVRPSGTEPKLKIYISVSAESKTNAEIIEKGIIKELNEYLKLSQS